MIEIKYVLTMKMPKETLLDQLHIPKSNIGNEELGLVLKDILNNDFNKNEIYFHDVTIKEC